jgi:hypothetical protein
VPELELAFRAVEPAGWPAWLFAGLVVLLVPAALASRRALERSDELPPPAALYAQLSVQLAIVGGVAWLAARDLGLAPWSRPLPSPRDWALGAAVLAGMLGMAVAVWRITPPAERERGAALLPDDACSRALAVLTSSLAGLVEELAWRAVLPALLWHWTGQAWVALAVAALTFGLAHAVQGRLAMAVVFAVAIAFQVLVEATGSLWVAIVVHAAYDALAVLWLSPYLRARGAASP